MSTVVRRLRFIAGYFRLNLAMAMAYRGSFLAQVFFMAANDAFLLFFWWVLFRRFPAVAGWGFREMVTLYAASATAFGLGATFCSNFLGLSRLISEGQLDYYLAAPQDPFLHVLVARGWFAGWGDIAFGVGTFLLAGGGGSWRLIVFPAVVLCGAAVLVSFGFIYGSLAFFWGRSEAVSGMARESLVTFSIWPGEIFPASLRFLFFTIIPAGLVSHLPVRLLARFEWPLFLALLAAAAGSVLLAGFVFRAGLRRYESGNLVMMRD